MLNRTANKRHPVVATIRSVVSLCVVGFVALSGQKLVGKTFCSSKASLRPSSPRSFGKVTVKFGNMFPGNMGWNMMNVDQNKDGRISEVELRDAMLGFEERGRVDTQAFYTSIGLQEQELSAVFTAIDEDQRGLLWNGLLKDMDMGTANLAHGFPYFNSAMNVVIPVAPKWGHYEMDADGDGTLTGVEFQEAMDWVETKAKIDMNALFKGINMPKEELQKVFTEASDEERLRMWEGLLQDLDLKNHRIGFPLFSAALNKVMGVDHHRNVLKRL